MLQLESYLLVPKKPVPVHEDGPSAISMIKGQKIRASSIAKERHSNLVRVMGEFYQQMTHLQDIHGITKVGSS